MSTYTIEAGDTLNAIATELGASVQTLESLNPGIDPNDLQIGEVINIPGPNTYTIVQGDTFSSIASGLGITVQTLENLNPGVNPDDLQIGQVITVPSVPSPNPAPEGYVPYSGPASNFPDMSEWADYQSLWAFNSTIIKNHGLYVPEGIAYSVDVIDYWIPVIATESGVDERVILCIIMQESGGDVYTNTSVSPTPPYVNNTGIMQAFNGASVETLETAKSPTTVVGQMIRDGTEGTDPEETNGLKGLWKHWGNWYEVFRAYNSGSVDTSDLNDGLGATDSYVSDVANRLMGHQWSSQ